MDIQNEVGLMLGCVKDLSLNEIEEHRAYGILLNMLLTSAEEN